MGIQLTITNQDGTRRTFDLTKDRTTIGRRRNCDLHVALPSVAPLHCEITVESGLIHLLNRDPEAKTFHNGNAVNKAELSNADIVKIGPVEFTITVEGDETVIRRR
ncbi:MAG: FHA domain-containing protein [Phycisphaerales bacterium]|jgi:predicted component of type VI protein secretion system|nr:FHA domain-containing protein [Phycisphaerales bacterium]